MSVENLAPESRPWRKLDEQSIAAEREAEQVRAMLARCLPEAMPTECLRAAVEQALLEALARRKGADATLPLIVVSCLDESGSCAAGQAGWSFFVIERPAPPCQGGIAARDLIELRLYHE